MHLYCAQTRREWVELQPMGDVAARTPAGSGVRSTARASRLRADGPSALFTSVKIRGAKRVKFTLIVPSLLPCILPTLLDAYEKQHIIQILENTVLSLPGCNLHPPRDEGQEIEVQ